MTYFETIYGATPIEDVSDLFPTHITKRSELNEWEAANILKAAKKYLTIRKPLKLTVDEIMTIHKNMFDETWKWAGNFRTKNYNIGVDWHNIRDQLKLLVDDLNAWQKDKHFDLFEQSVRLHHRLVKIHPFVNGNGRHARLVSDIFLFSHGQQLPTWPNQKLIEETDVRKRYIDALRSADKGDYKLLEDFTRNLVEGKTL